MVVGVVDELGFVLAVWISWYGISHGPAGEGPGRLLDIIFAVVEIAIHANAQGE